MEHHTLYCQHTATSTDTQKGEVTYMQCQQLIHKYDPKIHWSNINNVDSWMA